MNGRYLIEMATSFRYVVEVVSDDGEEIRCSACLWIAETGCRMAQFLATGPTPESEIEDMGPGAVHRKSALISAFPWNHDIPVTT